MNTARRPARRAHKQAAGVVAAPLLDAIWVSNNYARAVLYNGLGRHDAARDAAWEVFQRDPIAYGTYLAPELAEAASRTADRALLKYALD